MECVANPFLQTSERDARIVNLEYFVIVTALHDNDQHPRLFEGKQRLEHKCLIMCSKSVPNVSMRSFFGFGNKHILHEQSR